jgi:hypothetical protein
MFEEIRSAIDALEAVVRDLEPGLVDGPGATRLMELFVRGEHVCAAGKAITTRRVAETNAHCETGQRSAAHLLASMSGVSVGSAEALVRTVERLDDLPATNEAFRSGKLSEAQAREITYAASKDPSSSTTPRGPASCTTSVRCTAGTSATARCVSMPVSRRMAGPRCSARWTPRPTGSFAKHAPPVAVRPAPRTWPMPSCT